MISDWSAVELVIQECVHIDVTILYSMEMYSTVHFGVHVYSTLHFGDIYMYFTLWEYTHV